MARPSEAFINQVEPEREERNMDTQKKDKGFTLVELLIVIVILGILATVTVFAVRGITDDGQASACAATEKTYEVAVEAYYAKFGADVDPSGADLETAGLVRSYDSTNFTVTAGAITPTAGGPCV
jgi:general secretion pathway protein G